LVAALGRRHAKKVIETAFKDPQGQLCWLLQPNGSIVIPDPALCRRHARQSTHAAGHAIERAEADALNAYLCATMHVAFAYNLRGARWADSAKVQEAMKKKVGSNLEDRAALISIRSKWPSPNSKLT
jgi:glutathione S-transferase